jgi:AraC-like DNA-binding protein
MIENGYENTMAQLSADLGFFRPESFVSEFRHYLAIDPDRYRELRKKVNYL